MATLLQILIDGVVVEERDITDRSTNESLDFFHVVPSGKISEVRIVGDGNVYEYYIGAIDVDYNNAFTLSTPPPPPPSPPMGSETWPTDPAGPITMGIKSFASVGDMANNARRSVATVGELSTYSETFSRDRQLSSNSFILDPLNPQSAEEGLHQSVFSARNSTGANVVLESNVVDLLDEVAAWVYRNGLDGQFDDQSETPRQMLMAESATPLYDLEFGAMVQQGGNWYPESMSFVLTKAAVYAWHQAKYGTTLVLDDNYQRTQVKIWFSDRAFQAQYDEYEVAIVAPIDTIDDFFRTASAVQGKVSAVTVPMLMNKIRDVADRDPYTEAKSMEFDWNDPLTAGNKIRTVWSFVVYGNAGLSVDAIKEALRTWILANSTHTREEWTAIFPDIFRSTEFIFMPMWSRYAIPNMTLAEGVYSPIVDYQDALISGQKVIAGIGYTTAHLVDRMAFIGTPYKSVAMMVCGGPENRVTAKVLNQVWPDYISVVTSSPDFGRMQPATQQWVNTLQLLMRTAEEATEFSEIPTGYSRIRRKNPSNQTVTYISTTIDNIQYMVVTKASMHAIVPASDYGVTPDDMPLSLLPATDLPLQTAEGSKELSIDFEAIGGEAPYTYSLLVTDDMDAGVIGPATGQTEIAFKSFGSYIVSVNVTDALGHQYRGDYTVEVRP